MRRAKYLLSVIFVTTLLLTGVLSLHGNANAYQVEVSLTLNSQLTGSNIFLPVPLPINSQITSSNFYVINQYGYYIYSYLFSTTPPYLMTYVSSATNTTLYITYGNGITPQYVTTQVFSDLYNFYILNTSFWNVTNAQPSAGYLVMYNDSHIYFQQSEPRFNPSSVLYLFNFLPSASLYVPSLSYSGATLPGGTAVFFNFFSTTGTVSLPAQYLMPYKYETIVTSYMSTNNFAVTPSYVEVDGSTVYVKNDGVVNVQPGSITVSGTTLNAPNFNGQGSITTNETVVLGYGIQITNNVFYGYSTLVFTPSMINGSNWYAYEDGQLVNLGSVSGTLTLSNSPQMFVVPNAFNNNYITFYDIPTGSVVTVQYVNGTTATFTASGSAINTVGTLPLTVLEVPAGSGVASFTVRTPESSQQYTLIAGFTDFIHVFYVNITDGYATVEVNGTVLDKLGQVQLPATIAIGTESTSNGMYLIGQVYDYNGQLYDFIIPLSLTVYNTVPYARFTSSTGSSIVLTQIGVTLANGLFYELSGLMGVTISPQYTVNSVILNLVTQPGLTIYLNNGNVYTKITNSSSTLTIVGANGYAIQLSYGYVQQNTIISSNVYSVNLPSSVPILVSIDPTTRIITINANSQQNTPVYYKKTVSLSTNTSNITIATPGQFKLSFNVNVPQLFDVADYYIGGALFIYFVNRNYEITKTMWYGAMIWSFTILIMSVAFGLYFLLVGAFLGLAFAYVMKYMGK